MDVKGLFGIGGFDFFLNPYYPDSTFPNKTGNHYLGNKTSCQQPAELLCHAISNIIATFNPVVDLNNISTPRRVEIFFIG
jgi:hypothetical protein